MSLAFVFPGQGSQSEGMLSALAAEYAEVETTYREAAEVLGYDLWDIVQNGPADKLNSTDITQPAMLAAGVAVWRVWQAKGGAQPAVLAGHSLGEYTALVCGGSLAFTDAIKLVAERGRLMQAAVPAGTGAMAAVLGLEDDAVRQACSDAAAGEVLEAVNFNSPGQVVVAGDKAAVERVVDLAKERGAKRALLLPVSVPSHCALMKPAAEQLASVLNDVAIQAPTIPVINNVDVVTPSDPDTIRNALVRQLHSPGRWVETIQKMATDGVDHLLECGPGKVLVGLNKRIERKMAAQAVFDPDSLSAALAEE
ncbi:MAG: ACP S-malonyltransferase [Halobacteria archaeon]|nr:ACP S-malonyltransferase [Halobacteria archaeon]